MIKPNLFIIGAPKCATSSLATYLSEHPDVFLSTPKEPFFWSEDYPGLRKRFGMNSLEDYMGLFEPADGQGIVAEGSTNYLRSKVAVENIMRFNPDAKFIVMLRDPVQVAHAFHSEILFSRIENVESFEEAWRLQADRKLGLHLPAKCEAEQFLQYGEVASYADDLERFFELVPADQRQVILFDDFASDTRRVFNGTLEFLDLAEFVKPEFQRCNASHDHRFPALSRLLLDPPTPVRPLVESARSLLRRAQFGPVEKMKHALRKPAKRTALTPEFHNELCDFFAPDIARTSQLLGRDLSSWAVPKEVSNEPECAAVGV